MKVGCGQQTSGEACSCIGVEVVTTRQLRRVAIAAQVARQDGVLEADQARRLRENTSASPDGCAVVGNRRIADDVARCFGRNAAPRRACRVAAHRAVVERQRARFGVDAGAVRRLVAAHRDAGQLRRRNVFQAAARNARRVVGELHVPEHYQTFVEDASAFARGIVCDNHPVERD